MRAQQVLDWINAECPPLSWNIISMRLFNEFRARNINVAAPDPAVQFDDELLQKIDAICQEKWEKSFLQS